MAMQVGAIAPDRAEGAASASVPLLRNRDFSIFWLGQALSALGDAFALIALPLLVLQATGSVAQMGLLTGAFGAGQLIAGLFSGALVDRVDRRRLMILCDTGRCLLYAAVPLGWWTLGPHLWLLYLVVIGGAILGNIFQVAYITAVANLVEAAQLTKVNGRLQATLGLAFVLGPALAGSISARFGPAQAIGLDALTFAVSGLSLSRIRLRCRTGTHAAPPRRGPMTELLAGLRFVWGQPILRSLVLLYSAFALLISGINDLLIFHLKHDLHQGDAAVGLLFGVGSAGMIVGGLTAPALRQCLGFGVCWIGGLILVGISIVMIGLTTGIAVLLALSIVWTVGDQLMGINSMSLRQQITPDHLLGRVTAAFWTLIGVSAPLGAAGSTWLAAHIGAPTVLWATGALTIAIAMAALATPVRLRHPERA